MSYIKVVNKKYADEYVVGNLLKYGEEGENREFLGGCGISDLSDKYASRDMNFVKKLYGKENGRQAYQIIISIYKNRKTKTGRILKVIRVIKITEAMLQAEIKRGE